MKDAGSKQNFLGALIALTYCCLREVVVAKMGSLGCSGTKSTVIPAKVQRLFFFFIIKQCDHKYATA